MLNNLLSIKSLNVIDTFLNKYCCLLACILAFSLGYLSGKKHQPVHAFQPVSSYEEEVQCLTQAVFHEARGEPVKGWKLVMDSIKNRQADSHWRSSSVCGIVYQEAQYSFTWYTQDTLKLRESNDKVRFEKIKRFVEENWNAPNLIGYEGINHYLRCDIRSTTSQQWFQNMELLGRVGAHCFYKGY